MNQQETTMHHPRKTLLLRLVLLGAIFTGLYNSLEWSEVERCLQEVSPGQVIDILMVYSLVHIVRFARFKGLTPQANSRALFGVTSLHVFYLRVLPFRSGELAYAFLLRKAGLGNTGTGLAHLAYTRFLDVAVVALVATVGWLLLNQPDTMESIVWFAAALFLVVSITLVYLGPIFQWVARILTPSIRGTSGWVQRIGKPLANSFTEAADCVEALHPRHIAISIGFTVLLWGLAFLVMGLALETSYQEVGFAQVMIGGSTTIVASFLPVGIIGTFGVLEAGWILGFTSVGVPLEDAVASAIVYSMITLLGASILAISGYPFSKRN